VKDRPWYLITDDELAALLQQQGCTRVQELVESRDTPRGFDAVEKALSRPPGPSGPELRRDA